MRARLLTGLLLLGLLIPAGSSAAGFKRGELALVRIIIRGLGEKPPNAAFREGRVFDPLYTRYFLRTHHQQKARLQFVDGTVFNVNQDTDAVLQDPNHTTVNQGEVDQVDKHGSVHRITANGAVATANGTNFDVKVVKGRAFFVVDRGLVTVTGAGASVKLRRNQESIVVGRGRPSPARYVNADAVIAWTRGLNSDGWEPITVLHPSNSTFSPSSAGALGVGGGHIYALGGGEGGVVEFTTKGKVVRQFGGHAQFGGLAVDHGNNVYGIPRSPVSATPHISEYSAAGKLIKKIPVPASPPGTVVGYASLAVDSHGNLWTYADSLPGSGQLGLLKLSPSGAVLATVPGGFVKVAVAPNDDVYAITQQAKTHVTDIIRKYSPTGQLLSTWPLIGPNHTLPEFGGIAVSSKGLVFAAANSLQQGHPPYEVADTGGYIFELTASGKLRSIWGKAYAKWPRAGAFLIGGAIGVDAKGNVYVVDNDRIQMLPWFDT